MTENRSLPPAAEACLIRPYPSSQKGGTLIAEDVLDLATHERRLCDPDGYRPVKCLRCGASVHIHALCPRLLLADPALLTEVVLFRCAARERCGAVWRILPAFLARHLWRSWRVVEEATETPQRSDVPARTRRRWAQRLASAARTLVVLLTSTASMMWSTLATAVGLDGRRLDLVRCYPSQMGPAPGQVLSELAGLVHRLAPGVRLL